MKNVNLKAEGSVHSNLVKNLEIKIADNFQIANLTVKDFSKESQVTARLGVVFDWSNETMIIQAHR
jgi:hypothetical protein